MKIREILNNYMSGYFHHENTSRIKSEDVAFVFDLSEEPHLPDGEYVVWYSEIRCYASDDIAIQPEYTLTNRYGAKFFLVRIDE